MNLTCKMNLSEIYFLLVVAVLIELTILVLYFGKPLLVDYGYAKTLQKYFAKTLNFNITLTLAPTGFALDVLLRRSVFSTRPEVETYMYISRFVRLSS